MVAAVLKPKHWDAQYGQGFVEWDTKRPSTDLRRVLAEQAIEPCRALDVGCGTGANAVWLAQQGFDVTGVDLSELAIREARWKAAAQGLSVRFVVGDLRQPGLLQETFGFFFDCGCYHAVRTTDAQGYRRAVERLTSRGAWGLVLVGNDAEPEEQEGPPVMNRWQLYEEWGCPFEIVQLRPFRFDPRRPGEKRYLGWSCLMRRHS